MLLLHVCRYAVLITIAVLLASFAVLFPKTFRAVVAAWSYKDELDVFVNMDQDLQKRARQLKGFLRLKDEVRGSTLGLWCCGGACVAPLPVLTALEHRHRW